MKVACALSRSLTHTHTRARARTRTQKMLLVSILRGRGGEKKGNQRSLFCLHPSGGKFHGSDKLIHSPTASLDLYRELRWLLRGPAGVGEKLRRLGSLSGVHGT